MAKADLSDAYENMKYIPGGGDFPERWADTAADWRNLEHAIGRARLNLSYGPHERHALDLFLPAGRPEGLSLFVHGGYWHRFDRSYWSHLAQGATQAGWAVAMPSYRLAPEVRLSEITGDIAAAITHAAGMVSGDIRLFGHSAGGHLICRMNELSVLPDPVAARVKRLVPISPLSDLRPLMQTEMNGVLGIDLPEAHAESPVRSTHRHRIPTTVWVGANERPAFLEQAKWLRDAWAEASLRVLQDRHHFDVIEDLQDDTSAMVQSLLT